MPSVRSTYNHDTYFHPQLERLAALSPPSSSTLIIPSALSGPSDPPADDAINPRERIPWSDLSPPDSVVCYGWVRGFHIDLEWLRATWERPYSFLRTIIQR